jgi:hypothetical protein
MGFAATRDLGATILIGAPALAGTTWATARLFYPDAAWGLFAFGVVTVASGVTRLAVSLADVRVAGNRRNPSFDGQ